MHVHSEPAELSSSRSLGIHRDFDERHKRPVSLQGAWLVAFSVRCDRNEASEGSGNFTQSRQSDSSR